MSPNTVEAQTGADDIVLSDKSSYGLEDEKIALDVEVTMADETGEEIRESDYTIEQYSKLLKKIDRYLLPLMWVCYGIQQCDKNSMSTQVEDTGLVGQQYQWLTTIFYLSYLCGELPSNFLLQRWALGRTLSLYMLAWGIVVICIAAAQNWTSLMILRGLQGFFECTISPGFLLIVGSWYRTEEHPSRALFWQSANAGFAIFSSLVIYGIGVQAQTHGGLDPWRTISLFLGSMTIVAAVACFFLLGSPREVKWLSKVEKRMAAARTVNNKAGRDVTGNNWSWTQVQESFKDPQLYFCMINAFLSSVPNGGLTTFANLILKSFGFTELQVLLVNLPHNVISVLLFIAVGTYTRRVKERRMYIMIASTIPPLVGFTVMGVLPNTSANQWIKYAAYLMTVPFVLSLFLGWSLIPSNVAGRTKKTVISSATFLGYCVGNMTGSQIFKTKDAPRYMSGTIGCVVCFALQFFLICAWRGYYVWQNKKRERAAAASELGSDEQERLGRLLGEDNVTDVKNPYFRYST